jgi:hypothetical protein
MGVGSEEVAMASWLATGVDVRGTRLAVLPMWCEREHKSWFDVARRRRVLLVLGLPYTLQEKTFLVCRQCREAYEITSPDRLDQVMEIAGQPQPTALHDALLPPARDYGMEQHPDAVKLTPARLWESDDSLFNFGRNG